MATVRWSLRLPPTRTLLSRNVAAPTKRCSAIQTRSFQLSQPSSARRVRPWAQQRDDRRNENTATPSGTSPQSSIPPDQVEQNQVGRNTELAETLAQSDTSDLITEVHIPNDPHGVLPPDHPALSLLGNSSLVIQRQLEMMNVLLGFEQANRYIIMDGQGQTLGYIAERDHGMASTLARQLAGTHRGFTAHIFDREEREVLRIHRPFAYISSRIRIYDPIPEGGYKEMGTSNDLQGVSTKSAVNADAVAQVSPLKLEDMRIIGEAQQQWAPLRRKYNLFSYRLLDAAPDNDTTARIESGEKPSSDTVALTESNTPERAIEAGMKQFAFVNERFLSWDFSLRDEHQNRVGRVNRNFGGFAREIFTDTGVYALRMDSAAESESGEAAEADPTAMTLDQRAVMLATAVSIDFDYFSRHSHGTGMMPIIPMGGGGAAAEGAGAAGAAGAAGGVAGGAARGAAGVGAGEGAIAGAGTMAGYEAMQRGVYGQQGQGQPAEPDPQSPQAAAPPDGNEPMFNPDGENFNQPPGQGQSEDTWNDDPWGKGGGPGAGDGGSSGEEGGGGGGGLVDAISDFFGE